MKGLVLSVILELIISYFILRYFFILFLRLYYSSESIMQYHRLQKNNFGIGSGFIHAIQTQLFICHISFLYIMN